MHVHHALPLLLVVFVVGCALMRSTPPADEPRAGEQTAQRLGADVPAPWQPDYLLYLPEGYGEQDRAWPLVLFLHGAGERGDSLNLVAMHGPPKLVNKGDAFPFILVSPQTPADLWWTDGIDYLDALLREVAGRYRVDEDRVYVTGLSMGGFGTWALAAAYPNRFAALAPICGGGEPDEACRHADVPTWAFHGERDQVVPVGRTEEMVEALQACNGDVRMTLYPDLGHDSWTVTYDNPELYEWLLKQRR